jgi:hypothetical protein
MRTDGSLSAGNAFCDYSGKPLEDDGSPGHLSQVRPLLPQLANVFPFPKDDHNGDSATCF